MHDEAIQERTRLRLLEETQAQEQRAMDLKLAAEQQRMTKEAALKVEQASHRCNRCNRRNRCNRCNE